MSRSLSTLSPVMQIKAQAFMKECQKQGLSVVIICTDRGQVEQEAAYNSGHSKAHFGQSAHNAVLPNGKHGSEAFDIGIIENGKYMGESPQYALAGKIGKDLGLVWAGDWKSFKEEAHFQNPEWRKPK